MTIYVYMYIRVYMHICVYIYIYLVSGASAFSVPSSCGVFPLRHLYEFMRAGRHLGVMGVPLGYYDNSRTVRGG